jgi:hypothetical protein
MARIHESSIHGSTGTRRGGPLLAALSAAGLFLSAAPEARAGDEFEDGFKDELGRVAAHEAVGIGRGVLAGILLAGDPRHYGGHRDHGGHHDYYDRGGDWGHYRTYPGWRYSYYRPYWGGHGRGYWHGHGWGGHHRHYRRHHHGHHHGHGCGH